MKVCIYGIGGVGGYLACRLHNAGMDIVMVSRGSMLQAIRSSGLKLESTRGDACINAASAKVTEDPATVGHVDLVIICVKAWQVEDVAHSLAPMLKPDTIIWPLQNGVESHEVVERIVGGGRTLMGFAVVFAYIKSPGIIAHTEQAIFLFGEHKSDQTDRVQRLTSALSGVSGADFVSPTNMVGEMWKKFIRIAPLSAVCATTRAPIMTWATMEECLTMFRNCIEEAIAVAHSKDIVLPDDTTIFANSGFHDLNSPNMTTSMARDILQGKPSEMEELIGTVVRLGREMGVPTPTFDFVYATLLPQEQRARGLINFFNEGAD